MCVMKKRSFLDTESLSALEAVAIIVLFFALIFMWLFVFRRRENTGKNGRKNLCIRPELCKFIGN